MKIITHFITLLTFVGLSLSAQVAAKAPNILFFSIDDLRPELSIYGSKVVKSPNIDALAAKGTMFENAYANVPVCGASRAVLMTGLRPTMSRFVDVQSKPSVDTPDAITMTRFFKENGYSTAALGKVYHGDKEDKPYWDENWHPVADHKDRMGKGYLNKDTQALMRKAKAEGRKKVRLPAFEAEDVADNAYYDGMIAERAIENLKDYKKGDKPFFMIVGFTKPHLPFNSPKKYWDMYDGNNLENLNKGQGENMPKKAFHTWGELRAYADIPKGKAPLNNDKLANSLRHGYYASVSYVDAQLGLIMKALKELELEEDTIVVLWGDHGFALGEHNVWVKHSSFSVANHIPLIFVAPGIKSQRISAPATSVDVFPTLAALTGLKAPVTLEGDNLAPVLNGKVASVKDAAYTRWKDGDTIRTERYHYTEWRRYKTGEVYERMLFDHNSDGDEMRNIAADNPEIVQHLSKRLAKQVATYEGEYKAFDPKAYKELFKHKPKKKK